MKISLGTITLILFLITTTSNNCFSQKKGDNAIIVQGSPILSVILDMLFNEGLTRTNSDSLFISTSSKSSGWIGEVSYLIKRTDSSVIFKGYVSAEIDGSSTGKMILENIGAKNSAYRQGFLLMQKMAVSLGFPVTYVKLPR